MRSLRWHILRVLILTITLTVSLSLALGYFATQRQFDAFVAELGRNQTSNLAQRLSQAYTQSGGWKTLDIALAEAGFLYVAESEHREQAEGEDSGKESELFHIDRIRVVIVDLEGRVILDNFSVLESGQQGTGLEVQRTEILDLRTGQPVGYAFVDVNQDFMATESLGFLRELLLSSAFGGLLIIAIALLLATSLSKRISAPVTALTRAMQAIAQRDEVTLLPSASSHELAQMSAAFNQMTSALQRQRNMRRRLINDVSHELNTPLTVIQLEATGLVDNLQTPMLAAQRIVQEVTMLRDLVNDLNWLAETDSGQMQLHLESCPIDKLLAREVKRWQTHAQSRHTSLSLLPLPQLPVPLLDPARIRQALGNIIHNALQRTERGRVTVLARVEHNNCIQISVQDDGLGIAPDDLPHIFERYYRADQSRSRGAGLGLDIARTIIEAHCGTIALYSDGAGRGTTVEFRLPLLTNNKPANSTVS